MVLVRFAPASWVLAAFFLVFPSFGLQAKEISTAVYTYRETVGEKVSSYSWQVEEKGPQRIVSVYEEGKTFINSCAPDGSTRQWQLKDDKHDIIAKRQGNTLHISGVRNGESYNETVEIDERPWFQPISYSLRNFLSSQETAMSFWTIRADSIEVTTLQVAKMPEEEIMINNIPTPAQKVEVRAEGFYAHFWHGTYWYRKSDKLFLMYRSVHGPVGTAETVVELLAEPEKQKNS